MGAHATLLPYIILNTDTLTHLRASPVTIISFSFPLISIIFSILAIVDTDIHQLRFHASRMCKLESNRRIMIFEESCSIRDLKKFDEGNAATFRRLSKDHLTMACLQDSSPLLLLRRRITLTLSGRKGGSVRTDESPSMICRNLSMQALGQ